MNGIEDFDRDWDDYLRGFGDVSGEHWLGTTIFYFTVSFNAYINLIMKYFIFFMFCTTSICFYRVHGY